MTTTTASEWRKKRAEGIEYELPEYGDIVRIRPIDAEFWFRTGRIPDFLGETVRKMIADEDWRLQMPSSEVEKTQEWLDWLDDLVRWTMISPKVVENPKADDEISIDEISYPDKVAIYSLFGRPATLLRRFRQKPVQPVAPVDAAKNNGTNAEPDIEYQSVGQQSPGDA